MLITNHNRHNKLVLSFNPDQGMWAGMYNLYSDHIINIHVAVTPIHCDQFPPSTVICSIIWLQVQGDHILIHLFLPGFAWVCLFLAPEPRKYYIFTQSSSFFLLAMHIIEKEN